MHGHHSPPCSLKVSVRHLPSSPPNIARTAKHTQRFKSGAISPGACQRPAILPGRWQVTWTGHHVHLACTVVRAAAAAAAARRECSCYCCYCTACLSDGITPSRRQPNLDGTGNRRTPDSKLVLLCANRRPYMPRGQATSRHVVVGQQRRLRRRTLALCCCEGRVALRRE